MSATFNNAKALEIVSNMAAKIYVSSMESIKEDVVIDLDEQADGAAFEASSLFDSVCEHVFDRHWDWNKALFVQIQKPPTAIIPIPPKDDSL